MKAVKCRVVYLIDFAVGISHLNSDLELDNLIVAK